MNRARRCVHSCLRTEKTSCKTPSTMCLLPYNRSNVRRKLGSLPFCEAIATSRCHSLERNSILFYTVKRIRIFHSLFELIAQRVRFVFIKAFCQIVSAQAELHSAPEQRRQPQNEQLRENIRTAARVLLVGLLSRIHERLCLTGERRSSRDVCACETTALTRLANRCQLFSCENIAVAAPR